MSKIHFAGIPCAAEKLWPSTQLTSNPDPCRTTCGNCRKTDKWKWSALAEERKILLELRNRGIGPQSKKLDEWLGESRGLEAPAAPGGAAGAPTEAQYWQLSEEKDRVEKDWRLALNQRDAVQRELSALKDTLTTPAPADAAGAGQPWGNEPWEKYLERQREKTRLISAQRDGAMLYGKACEQRRTELIKAAMRELPSYEEMLAPTPAPATAAPAAAGEAEVRQYIAESDIRLLKDLTRPFVFSSRESAPVVMAIYNALLAGETIVPMMPAPSGELLTAASAAPEAGPGGGESEQQQRQAYLDKRYGKPAGPRDWCAESREYERGE